VSDLPALMRSEVPLYDGVISTAESYWKTRIGAPNESRLGTKSPINSVKSINIPVLIIYGTGDSVVPNDQSERLVRALRSAGKNVEVDTLKVRTTGSRERKPARKCCARSIPFSKRICNAALHDFRHASLCFY
jgi:acetyl esterase/lipase